MEALKAALVAVHRKRKKTAFGIRKRIVEKHSDRLGTGKSRDFINITFDHLLDYVNFELNTPTSSTAANMQTCSNCCNSAERTQC